MIHLLISALTQNEDLRQDLWVAYLSGEINSTFSNKLLQLTVSQEIDQKASDNFQDIINLDIPQDTLDQLSDLQCSILFMTVLGYSLEQVGRYNDVEQVIIDEEMVNLTKHLVWVQNGLKASSKSRRKIRSH